ncbi:hypothetical protein IPC1347_00610 [Pseudomonas aeruginosa]|nr:hypothetical protein GFD20_14470 [Pseudomonas aeruginosa]TEF96228.1 hypothetical protein IPC1347_00610 [Pseudomonas aeruginosa]
MAVQCSVRGCCWRPRKQGNASSVFRGAELVDGMAQLRPELTAGDFPIGRAEKIVPLCYSSFFAATL